MKISLFNNSKDKQPATTLSIPEFMKRIKKGEWEPWIRKLRNTKDDALQKKLKAALPAVTLCGTCNGRAIEKSSNYIGIDIDASDNGKDLFDKAPKLRNDPYVHAVWRSSRGNGLWLLFKINHKKHAESFLGIEEYMFRTYSIVIDSACKDSSRLCFVSYDPDAYYKQNKKVFTKVAKPTPIPGADDGILHTVNIEDVRKITSAVVKERKDITSNYQDWLRLGFIYASLGEAGRPLYHQLSQFNRSYAKEDTDLQFNKCLKKVVEDKKVQGGKPASIQTLLYLVNKHKIKVKIEKKKTRALTEIKENSVLYPTDMIEEGQQTWTFGLLEFKVTGKEQFKCSGVSTIRTGDFLHKRGIRSKNKHFYLIKDNVVEEVYADDVYNMVFMEIKNLPKGIRFKFDNESDEISKDTVMGAAQSSIKRIVDNIPINTSFNPEDESKFLKDTDKEIFLKFEDGIVEVSAKGHRLLPYKEAKGLVWRKAIRPHYFKIETGISDVQKILDKAIGPDARVCYMSAIGYMVSTYFPPEGVPFLFCCDINLEDGVNKGGNGKDFIKQILSQFREVVTIPGKTLDLRREFALNLGNKDTEIFWFEDLNRGIKMDSFYNFGNGLPIRKLHTATFTVQAKIGVSLQHTIDMEGSSNTRRQIFLLFDNYFSKLKNGIKEEFGSVFGADWSEKKRHQFNNFMLQCCQLYLKKGVIKMSTEKISEARKEELGDDMFSQLKLDYQYTSQSAMDAVTYGGSSVNEMSQKHFVMNWRRWCEHMNYELVFLKTDSRRYYVMKKKVNLKLGKK